MSKLTAAERLLKNEEQLKKLSEQRKQLLNAIKEENEQKFKDIGIKIIKAVETNEQFKIDFFKPYQRTQYRNRVLNFINK